MTESTNMHVFLPTPTPISEPFWAACRQGELRIQQCQDCQKFLFYPSYMCPHCGGGTLQWQTISGKGEVHAVTVMERAAQTGQVPQVLVLIELDEGPVMMSRVVTDHPHAVAIGDRVSVIFEAVSDEISLPLFKPETV